MRPAGGPCATTSGGLNPSLMRVAAIDRMYSTAPNDVLDVVPNRPEEMIRPACAGPYIYCRLGPTNLVASTLFSFQRTGPTAKTLAGSCLRGQKKPRKSSHDGHSTIPHGGRQTKSCWSEAIHRSYPLYPPIPPDPREPRPYCGTTDARNPSISVNASSLVKVPVAGSVNCGHRGGAAVIASQSSPCRKIACFALATVIGCAIVRPSVASGHKRAVERDQPIVIPNLGRPKRGE